MLALQGPAALPPRLSGGVAAPQPAVVQQVRRGLLRVSVPSVSAAAPTYLIPMAGYGVYFPRSENLQGETLTVTLPGDPNTGGVLLQRGGRFRVPFDAASVYLVKNTAAVNGSGTTMVVYVATEPDADIYEGIENLTAQVGWPPSAYLGDATSGASGLQTAFDLTGNRPTGNLAGSAWTAAPSIPDEFWCIDRVAQLVVSIFDKSTAAASSVAAGTLTLRPWWYIPSINDGAAAVTTKITEAAAAGSNCVPDPNTYVPAVRERVFNIPIGVRTGQTPSWVPYQATANQARFARTALSGVGFTFEVTGIPAGAVPIMVVTAELMP